MNDREKAKTLHSDFDGHILLAAHEEDPDWRQMFSTGDKNQVEFLEGLVDYIIETYGPTDPVLITIYKLLFREAQAADDSHLAGLHYLDAALKLSEEIALTDCLEYGECLSYLGMIYVEEENPLALETLGSAIQLIESRPPCGFTGTIYDELPGLKSYFADVLERDKRRKTEPVPRSKIDAAAQLLKRTEPKNEGNTPQE